jgi:hypothetical protein
VNLAVTFGTEENFRTEYLNFEVADFESAYHAILGRPMLARFMAIPHYTYLVLKMPAPNGVLTVRGDLLVSFRCDNQAVEMAATSAAKAASTVLVTEAAKVDKGSLTVPEQTPTELAVDPAPSTKKVCLGLEDPSKTVIIGDNLGAK